MRKIILLVFFLSFLILVPTVFALSINDIFSVFKKMTGFFTTPTISLAGSCEGPGDYYGYIYTCDEYNPGDCSGNWCCDSIYWKYCTNGCLNGVCLSSTTCAGTDTSCGTTSCVNCNTYDSCSYGYNYDYYCSANFCTYTSSCTESCCDAYWGSTNAYCSGGTCFGPPSCTPNWSCTSWSPSTSSYNCGATFTQIRTCTDSNNCGTTTGKPAESQTSTGTYCTSDSCPSDFCSGLVYYDYPSSCSKTCSGGTCQSCLCSASQTTCDKGDPCKSYSCNAITGCGETNKADGTSCGTGKVCSSGSCVSTATGSCEGPGDYYNYAYTCSYSAGYCSGNWCCDGTYWKYCTNGCDSTTGKCISATTCTDECSTSGTKQCSGSGYQTCGNYDTDSCLEWSSVTACPSGQTCSGGSCTTGSCSGTDTSCGTTSCVNCNTYDSCSYGYNYDYYCSANFCTYTSSCTESCCDTFWGSTNAYCSGGTCFGPPSCTPNWSCTSWSPSTSSNNCGTTFTQTRTCTDSNNCGTTTGKPAESQTSTGTYCTSGYTCSAGSCISTIDNLPTASISAPSSANTGQSVSITVTATDDKDVLTLYMNDGKESGWFFYDCTGTQTSCSNTWTRTYNTAGNYTVQVYVKDSANQDSTIVSKIITVSAITSTAPTTPVLLSPAYGATSVSLTPTLDWSDVISSGGWYNLYYRKSTDSTWTTISSLTTSSYTFSTSLSTNTIYYWYVRACNSETACADSSSSYSFTTVSALTTLQPCDSPVEFLSTQQTGSATTCYTVGVPASVSVSDTLTLSMDSSVDYDLYVKWDGTKTTTSNYDCRPYVKQFGQKETCSKDNVLPIASGLSAKYYVLVNKSSGSGSFTLSLNRTTNQVQPSTTLNNYPNFLYTNGQLDLVIVKGKQATNAETFATNDIYLSLGGTTTIKNDIELTSTDKLKNLILIGGPCINTLVAELATKGSFPYTCASWPAESFGVIYVIDDAYIVGKAVLVVAGTRDEDMRLAASFLVSYSTKLSNINSKAVKVTGTSVENAVISTTLPPPKGISVSGKQLGDYPEFLYEDNVLNALIVISSQASPQERIAAINLSNNLGLPGAIKFDKDVTSSEKLKNLILIGNPCNNQLSNSLTTSRYTCNIWPEENFGMIEIIDNAFTTDKVAIVVAGTREADTLLATEVLERYSTKLAGIATTAIKITGASADSAVISSELPPSRKCPISTQFDINEDGKINIEDNVICSNCLEKYDIIEKYDCKKCDFNGDCKITSDDLNIQWKKTPPNVYLDSNSVSPISGKPGTVFTIRARVSASNPPITVTMDIKFKDEIIYTSTLYDDGQHGDRNSGDQLYGNTWDSFGKESGNYYITVRAVDSEKLVSEETAKLILLGEDLCKEFITGHNDINSNRINLVFVGINLDNIDDFKKAVERGLDFNGIYGGIFSQEPFKSNKNKFNFWYVPKIGSNEVKSFTDVRSVSGNAVGNLIKESQLLASYCTFNNEFIITLPRGIRGFGGTITVASPDDQSYEKVLIHEFGHSFGKLTDEYLYFSGSDKEYSGEPQTFYNLFLGTAGQCLSDENQWYDLIGNGCGLDGKIDCIDNYDPSSQTIREFTFQDNYPSYIEVACFESAQSYSKGSYRPGYNTIMRNHETFNTKTFSYAYGPVNERLICDQIKMYTGSAEGICTIFFSSGVDIVAEISKYPQKVGKNEPFTMETKVKNIGIKDSKSFTVAFSILGENNFDYIPYRSDSYMQIITKLSPGEEVSLNFEIIILDSFTKAKLAVFADSTNIIRENNENNNNAEIIIESK